MGALANVRDNFKESKIGLMLRDVYEALSLMVNSVGDEEQTVEEAVQATIEENNGNPNLSEELKKVIEINKLKDELLAQEANGRFGVKNLKDEERFNKLENKLSGIKTDVAGIQISEPIERTNGGNQKSRIDED